MKNSISLEQIKNNRKQLEEFILSAVAQVTTKDQYNKIKNEFNKLSDENLTLIMNSIPDGNYTLKDVENGIANMMNNISPEDRATSLVNANVLDDEETSKLVSLISKSSPMDTIMLTREQDLEIMSFWKDIESKNKKMTGVPSDLVFAKSVPITDLNIRIDEGTEKDIMYRVVIFDNYKSLVDTVTENVPVTIGAIVLKEYIDKECTIVNESAPIFIFPISILKGVNLLTYLGVAITNADEKYKDMYRQHMTMQQIVDFIITSLETWYGIQIKSIIET